jgi:hypothetical protein
MFGFLGPSLVLHGCHLVPAFADGQTTILLHTVSRTAAHPPGETDDWTNYYVTMYVFLLLSSQTSLLTLHAAGLIETCLCIILEGELAT